jgi:hypothetical protein
MDGGSSASAIECPSNRKKSNPAHKPSGLITDEIEA